MIIETITDLIHEYMYDMLNKSNKSNCGRGIQHIQKRHYKRKWSDNFMYERPRSKPDNQTQNTKTSGADNAEHLIGQECKLPSTIRRKP